MQATLHWFGWVVKGCLEGPMEEATSRSIKETAVASVHELEPQGMTSEPVQENGSWQVEKGQASACMQNRSQKAKEAAAWPVQALFGHGFESGGLSKKDLPCLPPTWHLTGAFQMHRCWRHDGMKGIWRDLVSREDAATSGPTLVLSGLSLVEGLVTSSLGVSQGLYMGVSFLEGLGGNQRESEKLTLFGSLGEKRHNHVSL